MSVAGIPTTHDAGRAEVDVLGMGLVIELWRKQPHHMHARRTAIAGQFAHRWVAALAFGKPSGELIDDVTQTMRLLLARDLACNTAGILHVLVPVQHLRHRGWLGTERIPEMHGENQRV